MKKFLSLLLLACLFLSVCFFISGSDLFSGKEKLREFFSFLPSGAGSGQDIRDDQMSGEAGPVIDLSQDETVCRQATVAAVGDIMVHRTQFVRAYDPQEESYDFKPSFEVIAPYLQKADLVVGNLETTLGGDKLGFSAYPRFNSPDEIVTALREAGFNLLCTANNHCLDTGEKGLCRTIKVIEEAGIKHFGTAGSFEERNTPLIVQVNGISLSFLAYTYGTNGLSVPRGKDYLVNLIDEEQMSRDISRARLEGADLVIVYLHWGEEYCTEPTESQKKVALFAAEAGADIILGSHPHVIQPMEYLHVPSKVDREKKIFVAYSLGNFLSNQHRISGSIPTDEVEIGKILYLCVEKNEGTGETYLRDINYDLTWVHRSGKHRILPLHRVVGGEFVEGEMVIPASSADRLKRDLESLRGRLEGFKQAGPEQTVPVVLQNNETPASQ